MTKVSVIVPVYNAEKYISKCVESVLAQTYKNIELILINDGSKDRSKEILDDYASKYEGKILVAHQKNMGIANTRNKGIKLATGKYIMFIDNDDFIDEDYIETFVKAAEKNKSDVVIGGYRRPDENGKIIKVGEMPNNDFAKYLMLTPWARIFNREYIIENDIKFLDCNVGEDIYFNLQAINISDKINSINYVGYNWYYNTESVSNTSHKSIKDIDMYDLLNETYNVLNEKRILEKYLDKIEYYFLRFSVWLLVYSTKKLDYKTISEEYDKLFNWFESHFPNYKKNKFIKFSIDNGETKIYNIVLVTFMFAQRCKLGKILVYLYSKI